MTKVGKGRFTKLLKNLDGIDIEPDKINDLLRKSDDLGNKTKGFYDDFLIADPDDLRKLADNPELVNAWKKLDDLGTDIVPDVLRRNPKLLEALDAPKGNRKAPSTYLNADYIANHLAKFDDGASRLVKKSDYDNFGIGKPDIGKTEFV